jgi:hypothetical protein
MTLEYELTEAEAEIAGARAAWRLWLAGGLRKRHVAPLAAFAAAIAAIAALGLTGAISRRAAELSLILSAIAFMGLQLWTRRGLAGARRRGAELAGALRGPVRLTLDEEGVALEGARTARLRFCDGLELETTNDLNYVWPHAGPPLVWPRRAHATLEEADAFLALIRSRAGIPSRETGAHDAPRPLPPST